MIFRRDVEVVQFRDQTLPNGQTTAHELMAADAKALEGMPVKLQVGAVSYQVGVLQNVRKGREAIFADIRLSLEGELNLKGVLKEEGKTSLDADAYILRVLL